MTKTAILQLLLIFGLADSSYSLANTFESSHCLCDEQTRLEKIQNKLLLINAPQTIDSLSKSHSFLKLMEALPRPDISSNEFILNFLEGFVLGEDPTVVQSVLRPGEYDDLTVDSRVNKRDLDLIALHWTGHSTFGELRRDVRAGKTLLNLFDPFDLIAVLYRPDLHDSVNVGGGVQFIFRFRYGTGRWENFHLMFEYKLSREEKNRQTWLKQFSDLTCLEGESYQEQLKTLLQSVTHQSGKAYLSKIHANIFLTSNLYWTLLEFGYNRLSKTIERRHLENTPKDAFYLLPLNYKKEFDRLSSEIAAGETYDMFDTNLAYQVRNRLSTSWGESLKTIVPATDEGTIAKYRFSLNTCNSCHSGTFQNHSGGHFQYNPSLKDVFSRLTQVQKNKLGALLESKNGEFTGFRYDTINYSNNFLHLRVDRPDQSSAFLNQDLNYRAQEIELFADLKLCALPSTPEKVCTIDYNQDGTNSVADLLELRKHILGVQTIQNPSMILDLNSDQDVSVLDILSYMKFLLRITSPGDFYKQITQNQQCTHMDPWEQDFSGVPINTLNDYRVIQGCPSDVSNLKTSCKVIAVPSKKSEILLKFTPNIICPQNKNAIAVVVQTQCLDTFLQQNQTQTTLTSAFASPEDLINDPKLRVTDLSRVH